MESTKGASKITKEERSEEQKWKLLIELLNKVEVTIHFIEALKKRRCYYEFQRAVF